MLGHSPCHSKAKVITRQTTHGVCGIWAENIHSGKHVGHDKEDVRVGKFLSWAYPGDTINQRMRKVEANRGRMTTFCQTRK